MKNLIELNFVKCTKELALYQRQYNDQYLLVLDEFLVTGSSVDLVEEFKIGMSSKFEMSDLIWDGSRIISE